MRVLARQKKVEFKGLPGEFATARIFRHILGHIAKPFISFFSSTSSVRDYKAQSSASLSCTVAPVLG
jgi:hypothetical protein